MNVNELNDFEDFARALQIIKGFCMRIGNCELCPFYIKRKGRGDKCCFFTDPNDGKIPEEWDIKKLLGGENDGQ